MVLSNLLKQDGVISFLKILKNNCNFIKRKLDHDGVNFNEMKLFLDKEFEMSEK